MRIGFISSYPPIECGVATYTQYLIDALRKKGVDVYVVCHMGGLGQQVFPSFDYEDGDLAEKAFSTMIRFTPDIVHIQHEFGLFGKHMGVSVIPLIVEFQLIGIPVVTTLHTVYVDMPKEHEIIIRSILMNSNYVIVHEEYQMENIKRRFPPDLINKVRVIPHGAREVEPISNAKTLIGLPQDKKVILMIGYIRPSKNFELIIDLFPEILKRCPDALLVIAGKIRGQEYIDYRNMLFQRIAESPAKENIIFIRGQLPQHVFDTIICSADVVVLPYKISSQSGILAHCLAFGRPIVASSSPGLENVIQESGAGISCNAKEEFVEAIVRIISDPKFSKKLSENGQRYVKNNISWSIIADKHLEIYNALMDLPDVNIRIISTE
ncbi:MAG: glycosyl transferase [Deltaproteobacteria bacterium]|nr:MAG: glycosyl transferase [Deltaproteobacteria bacterium]